MLDFDTAQKRLAESATPPSHTETRPLDELDGRVLAADIRAALDLPLADNSAMDGYALRAADVPDTGTTLPVQQRCFAGEVPQPLLAGHATRLFTGSLIPPGADTVVMQEACTEADGRVTINIVPEVGRFIRQRGEDMARGEVVLPAGTVLGAAQIAVLAAQGYAHAPAYPRLRVGILTTGDELLQPGEPLQPARLYDSNAPMLASLCRGLGTAPPTVRHAPDELGAIRQTLHELAESCDLVLSVGGASVGEKDLVKPAIEALGGTLDLWRVRMKPGKPVALATLQGHPLVCLPGNPASAFVVFCLLVSPLIRGLQGRRQILPTIRRGTLLGSTRQGGEREEFLRVQVAHAQGLPTLQPWHQQSSGSLGSLTHADGLARIPVGSRLEPGSEVAWYALADWTR